jgi:hypothetical protein
MVCNLTRSGGGGVLANWDRYSHLHKGGWLTRQVIASSFSLSVIIGGLGGGAT